MTSDRPGRLLNSMLEAIAPFWLNMSLWRATGVPFMMIFEYFCRCPELSKWPCLLFRAWVGYPTVGFPP